MRVLRVRSSRYLLSEGLRCVTHLSTLALFRRECGKRLAQSPPVVCSHPTSCSPGTYLHFRETCSIQEEKRHPGRIEELNFETCLASYCYQSITTEILLATLWVYCQLTATKGTGSF